MCRALQRQVGYHSRSRHGGGGGSVGQRDGLLALEVVHFVGDLEKIILIALGRLVGDVLEPRGEGFEPRAAGVVRAGALGHAFLQYARKFSG